MAELDAVAEKCNYAGYYEKFATYPPAGLLPLPGKSTENDRGCDVWDMIFDAAVVIVSILLHYQHRVFTVSRTPRSTSIGFLTLSLSCGMFSDSRQCIR